MINSAQHSSPSGLTFGRGHSARRIALCAALLLAACSPAQDQEAAEATAPAAQTSTGSADSDTNTTATETASTSPDLSGIWQAMNTAHWDLEGHTARKMPVTGVIGAHGAMLAGIGVVVGGSIPYRPEALAKRDGNRADWANLDPAGKCYIPGIPRQTYMPAPFQILQTDSEIFIAYEWGSNSRSIFMDRPGTTAPLPSWMGYSLGHWDGDTLVVDVTSQMPDTWFDASGNHHGPNLHVEERYTLIDDNLIDYRATITDPDTFTEAWTIHMPLYRRVEEGARLLEFKCVEFAEDLLYDHLRKGYDGPKNLDGTLREDAATND